MRLSPIRAVAALAITAALALTGCAASPADPADSEATAVPVSPTGLSGELTIFAAASLSGAFDQLAADFEAENPEVDVRAVTYDGSSVLATQIIEGAEVDVFASADERNMAKVTDAGLADGAEPFATNTLEIAVAPGNPLSIDGLDALTDDAGDEPLTVVLCAAEVPCGNASKTLIEAAGITITPASEEQNVTAVLSKVKSGEADAGLVYRTDVSAAGHEVQGVEIANADDAVNVYPLVSLADAPSPELASAFVEYVLSPAGQKVLESFGFGAP
ncbi:molybdate ABC transporter substrate-binding protein [Microbacterium sp.]|uniref:molybdate ABC transporter substrate-binding protein n=1 Tax=Microbacterium sp. TaxID=51671 RepID=UPI003F980E63